MLSFVIPVHNMERYLDRCLESVLRQKCSEYEILLIDDGSTDSSGKICDRYSEKYPQIRVIHQKQSGLSAARNAGIREARGEYFFLLDSDDMIVEGTVPFLMEKCKDGADVIAFEHQLFYTEDEIGHRRAEFSLSQYTKEDYDGKRYLQAVLSGAVLSGQFYQWSAWTYCYKTSFFKEHGFQYPVGRNYEDLSLTWKVIIKAQSVSVLPMVIYAYRKGVAGSITKTYNYKNINDRLISTVENMELIENDDTISPELKSLVEDHFSEHYFIVLTMTDLPATREERKMLMVSLKQNLWISRRSLRKTEQILSRLINIFGFQVICALLHMRRKIVYHGQFKRSTIENRR